jgi:hypothetical protein
VPKSAVTITGDVKYYDVKGDSGQIVSRGFYPACGARLFLNPAMMSDVVGIMAGALDDPTWFQSTMDIYTASAQPLHGECTAVGLYELRSHHVSQDAIGVVYVSQS